MFQAFGLNRVFWTLRFFNTKLDRVFSTTAELLLFFNVFLLPKYFFVSYDNNSPPAFKRDNRFPRVIRTPITSSIRWEKTEKLKLSFVNSIRHGDAEKTLSLERDNTQGIPLGFFRPVSQRCTYVVSVRDTAETWAETKEYTEIEGYWLATSKVPRLKPHFSFRNGKDLSNGCHNGYDRRLRFRFKVGNYSYRRTRSVIEYFAYRGLL